MLKQPQVIKSDDLRLFHLLRTGSAPGGSAYFPMRWSPAARGTFLTVGCYETGTSSLSAKGSPRGGGSWTGVSGSGGAGDSGADFHSRFTPVSRSNRWAALPRKVKRTGVPMARARSRVSSSSSDTGTTMTTSRPQASTWIWMALPIISDTSTLAKMALSAVVRTMCSGRTPRVTGPLSTPPSASRRHFSGERVTVAPARDT